MNNLNIEIVPYYDDNFSYLIHDIQAGTTALVDCGEADPVLRQLKANNWRLDFILATHFHFDHAGDIEAMKNHFPEAVVVKPAGEDRLTMEAMEVTDGNKIGFGQFEIEVLSLPAHTKYCTGYHIEGNMFVGDALFSAGCGRLFEGQPADLERAMDKILSYSDDTNIFFGHEYTQSNIRFAQSIEPGNKDLDAYQEKVNTIVGSGQFSTPTTVEMEKRINPFLRIDHPDVVKAVDLENKLSRTERMGKLRSLKDSF